MVIKSFLHNYSDQEGREQLKMPPALLFGCTGSKSVKKLDDFAPKNGIYAIFFTILLVSVDDFLLFCRILLWPLWMAALQ